MTDFDTSTVVSIPVRDATDDVREQLAALQQDVIAIRETLEPLGPFIEAMPEALSQILPLVEGLRNSPVVKMLGIKLP